MFDTIDKHSVTSEGMNDGEICGKLRRKSCWQKYKGRISKMLIHLSSCPKLGCERFALEYLVKLWTFLPGENERSIVVTPDQMTGRKEGRNSIGCTTVSNNRSQPSREISGFVN